RQIFSRKIQRSLIFHSFCLRRYGLYYPVSHFNGCQIRPAVLHIQYIRIDYLFHHHASTSCMSFASLSFIAVLNTSDSSCLVSRLATTRTTSENTYPASAWSNGSPSNG